MDNKKYSKHLVKNLDDTKQWAALHYAVYKNNMYVFNKLTNDEKCFRCGMIVFVLEIIKIFILRY